MWQTLKWIGGALGWLFGKYLSEVLVAAGVCVLAGSAGAFLFSSMASRSANVLNMYLAVIATVAALAAVSFSYATVATGAEKESLTIVGELFLYGSLRLIYSLIVIWFASFLLGLFPSWRHGNLGGAAVIYLIYFVGTILTLRAAGSVLWRVQPIRAKSAAES